MKTLLESIIGKKVERLFIIVWPPYGEDDIRETDMSFGFIFEDKSDEIFNITTDKNDLTQPAIGRLGLPKNILSWNNFEQRMKDWMECNDELDFEYEFYEVTTYDIFDVIVGKKIVDIQLIGDEKEQIFGMKLQFKDDYIISFPNTLGNTIETSTFKKYSNIRGFSSWGEIQYFGISEL